MTISPFLVLALASLEVASVQAPPDPPPGGSRRPPAYDAASEVTIRGTVTSVEVGTRGPGRLVSLVFQTDSNAWKVIAGPEEVVRRQGATLAAGDTLTITGAPMSGPEGQVFLARQITKGDVTLTLLDPSQQTTSGPDGPPQSPAGARNPRSDFI